MKKGLIGCLLVGVVLIAVGAGLAWWFVLKPMVGAGEEIVEAARDWNDAANAEAQVRNQAPFAPPADGRLTQEQVNAFVDVQANVQLRLGPEFETLRGQFEQAQAAAAGGQPDLSAATAAMPGLAALVARAREAQVEGLNRNNLSLAEYRWIRDQAYAALPFLDLDPDAIVAPKPPPGAAVDAATGEVIEIPDEPVDALAADGTGLPAPEDSGLEYAGTAPDDIDEMARDAAATAAGETRAPPKPAADSIEALGTVADRGLGDDRALDDAKTQAARANAVLLRPHEELLLATLGTSWAGL